MATRPKLRRRRRTKIIATLGPASSSPEVLTRLFQAGADVFRLNFSHGTHEDHAARFAMIRQLEERFDRPIGILADVQGPKLRVGTLLRRARVPADRPAVPARPQPDAGRAPRASTCRIRRSSRRPRSAARCCWTTASCGCAWRASAATRWRPRCVVGGPLSDHKGVNVPDVVLPIPALTEKDRDDLAFALEHGANYIGLSFVQRPEDVAEAKELIGGRAWIMVKLEKPQALDNLDAIMQLTDAVMVARGDLGVELPPEEVPLAQKRIVRAGAPVGQAGGGGDADAGKHDQRARAHARRGLRRRDRGVRRRGCGDAVGRDRGRAVSVRGGQHDGPHRRARGAGPRLAGDDRGEPRGTGARHRRRDRRGGAAGVPHDRREGDRGLSPPPARPRCVSRANGRRRRSSA